MVIQINIINQDHKKAVLGMELYGKQHDRQEIYAAQHTSAQKIQKECQTEQTGQASCIPDHYMCDAAAYRCHGEKP
jgi:hypothetical protein